MNPELEKTVGQWSYICCEVWIHTGKGVSVDITNQCAACGNTNIRFTHTLEHREDKKQISVGIECAGILMDDWELPRLAERTRPNGRKSGAWNTGGSAGALPPLPTSYGGGSCEFPGRCIAKRAAWIPSDAGAGQGRLSSQLAEHGNL